MIERGEICHPDFCHYCRQVDFEQTVPRWEREPGNSLRIMEVYPESQWLCEHPNNKNQLISLQGDCVVG